MDVVLNLPSDPLKAFGGAPQEVEQRLDQLIAGDRHYAMTGVDTVLTQLHDYR